MRTSTLLTLIIPISMVVACNPAPAPATDTKKDTVVVTAPPPPPPPKNDKIRNGVKLNQNGLVVSQAFLLDQDDKLVSDENKIGVNQYLTLRLIIDTGFVTNNGMVKLGASEKVTTSDGNVLLDEKDLFAEEPEVSATDAKIIQLKVIVNNIAKLQDYYEVSFRVWDKIGANDVTGTYRFNVK